MGEEESKINIEIKRLVDSLRFKGSEYYTPVFEAVVNSIQSIHKSGNIKDGKIVVKIHRDASQKTINSETSVNPPIIGFEILDNGIGFNLENFNSFCTAYSSYKKEIGCKGIGRFYWLKAFSNVHIDSTYVENGLKKRISFDFGFDGVKNLHRMNEISDSIACETIVSLNNLQQSIREKNTAYRRADTIAQKILEHCLEYFIYDLAPEIIVTDEDNAEGTDLEISLRKEYASISPSVDKTTDENVMIGKFKFSIVHVKIYSASYSSSMGTISYCANNREVIVDKITDIFGVNQFNDEFGKSFLYCTYVSGEYLDNSVDDSRTEFNIPQSEQRDLEKYDSPLSFDVIRAKVKERIKKYLNREFEQINFKNIDKLNTFCKDNPLIPHATLKYFYKDVLDKMLPNMTDEKIASLVYESNQKFESELYLNTREIMGDKAQNLLNIQDRIPDLSEKLNAINVDALAKYIIHRKILLDYIKSNLGIGEDGKTVKEEVIHNAIFPKWTDSEKILDDAINLWILDDRLTFYGYASSDKVIIHEDAKINTLDRPDILVYNDIDGIVARTIVIIEFKRPERDDKKEDIVKQLTKYISNIKAGEIRVGESRGRKIIVDESTQYYCYGLCDLTPELIDDLENVRGFSKLPNGLGYYSYLPNLHAHLEILSYQHLIPDAENRNRIFFKKLGIENLSFGTIDSIEKILSDSNEK